MAETKLSPPILETKLPAFAGMNLTIPFGLNKAVAFADIKEIAILVKSVQNNVVKMEYRSQNFYYDTNARCYKVMFDINAYNNSAVGREKPFQPQVCQFYKVQIAYISHTDTCGFYSSVGVIKHTSAPEVYIKELNNDKNNHVYEYTGVYSQKESDTNPNPDVTEKVYSYRFNLYNDQGELVATSDEKLHNSSTDTERDQSSDVWTVRRNLDPNILYQIEYIVTTMNGLKAESGRYPILEAETKEPNIHATFHAIPSYDEGRITLKLIGDKSGKNVSGKFILLRSSSEDNFDSWYEMTRFDLSYWDSNEEKEICKDYTVRQGESYLYAIRAFNSSGLFSNKVYNEGGAVQCDFEDAFLYDGERQLKIRFNPKVANFKSTVLETKTNTIGGKYPFIFRNGNVEYKEFSVSGLISLLADANNEFKSNLPAAEDEVLHESGHWLTTDNIRKEREFKMLVLNWLTNGKPKLFRSPTEGNFIVRLTNVSLTPNDTIGRVLHTFNSQASEIAEFNFDNLKKYGFALDDYTEARALRMAEIDLAMPPVNMETDGVINLPAAVYASISNATPQLGFTYTQQDVLGSQHAKIGLTGQYYFPSEVLVDHPLTSIAPIDGSWNKEAKLLYGYYDTVIDSFSSVYDMSFSDRIVQVLGKGMDTNIINDFEDIRTKVGSVHYLRVQPREKVYIYLLNGRYWYNNNGQQVTNLHPTTLYYIIEGYEQDTSIVNNYIDGSDGYIDNATPRPISSLNFDFRITGMKENQIVDFNGFGDTNGRYEALTNMSSLKDLYAGNGMILDIIYQEKITTYIVEVEDSQYSFSIVIIAKNNWQNAINQGLSQTLIDRYYDTYISELDKALEHLEEIYDVEYAI